MKRILTAIFTLILCTSLLFTGCTKNDVKTKNDKELNSTVVATIGNEKITQADYNFIYKSLYESMSQYSSYYGSDWENMEIEDGKTISDYIKENTMLQLEQLAASVELGRELGIKLDRKIKKSVDEQKKDIIEKNYGSNEKYVEFLEDAHTTDEAITNYLRTYEIYSKVNKKLTSKDGKAYIKDSALEKDFLEEYKDKQRVQHILVSTQEQTNDKGETIPAKSDSEAQTIVKEVLDKLAAGENFNDLIDTYNDDPGMSKGNYYTFGDGEMVPEFEEAAKNLKVGEYTKEAVKTDYGYHIIKKYEINTKISEFTEYKNTKMAEKAAKIIEKKAESLKKKTENKVIDKYLDNWAKERKAEAEKAEKEAQKNATKEPEANTQDNATEQSETEKEGKTK